jgi:thymidylate kinase
VTRAEGRNRRGRRGATVALIGCDGAGKTTVARALEREGELPIRYLYMGVSAESSNRQLPTTRLANAVKRARRGGASGGPDGASAPLQTQARTQASGPVKRMRRATRAGLRLTNRLAEEWYRQLIAETYRARGEIVVFDRHFAADYHAFDIAGNGRPLARRIHGWVLSRAYPKPDLVVFLDAPPAVLHARKGEGTLASLARRRADYLRLADGELGGSFAVVSATQPLPRVVDEVATLIREHAASA